MTKLPILAGRYELLERLGSGGMAVVWRALDRSLDREVAVKLLHANLAHDHGFVERFRREARHAASLAHPNVVTVYDSGTDGETPFIVMELVEGTSLHRLIADEGPLSIVRTAAIGTMILGALEHAHRKGIVHRDVKPGNVLIDEDGTAKVTDFGVAKAMEDADLTRTGATMGTAGYLSPEQSAGHPATPASDVYAAGCVLYQCLTGHPPFTGDNQIAVALAHQRDPVRPPSEQRPDLPHGLESVILRALEKDPHDRFASAAQMASALTPYATGPDEAPTVVSMAPVRAESTQVLRTAAVPGRKRADRRPYPRFLAWGLVILITLALLYAGTLLLGTVFPKAVPTPEPTPLVTLAPTPQPTIRRAPTPVPTPEATPVPTAEPTIVTRTPRPPRTPDLSIFDTPEPTAPPATSTP